MGGQLTKQGAVLLCFTSPTVRIQQSAWNDNWLSSCKSRHIRFSNNGGNFDGVIVSHGVQQDHIWELCCTQSPVNIGDNYFCESGNFNNGFERGRLYSSDRLWDGQQCEGSCCEGTQSPPWFSVQLPAPTTDMIEVSICCDQSTTLTDETLQLS